MRDVPIATFMIVMGLAIAGIWTFDIVRGSHVDLSGKLLRARDSDGSLMLPHWVAEFGTAAALLGGAVGLLVSTSWAVTLAAAAMGATWYTSTNALGWATPLRLVSTPMAIHIGTPSARAGREPHQSGGMDGLPSSPSSGQINRPTRGA